MKSFSTGDLSRKIGDVTHAASQAPVTITQHNKPRYVMMSVEVFESISRIPRNPRRVVRTDNPPDDILEWLLPQLEGFAENDSYDK